MVFPLLLLLLLSCTRESAVGMKERRGEQKRKGKESKVRKNSVKSSERHDCTASRIRE